MKITKFDRNRVGGFPESFFSIIQCEQILHLFQNLTVLNLQND